MREFRRLVVEFASAFVAQELDARRRADPRFAERATPAEWRALLRTARQGQSSGRWAALSSQPAAPQNGDEAARWQAEAQRLADDLARLTAELELARLFKPVAPAPGLKEGDRPGCDQQEPGPSDPAPEPSASLRPAPVKPGATPKAVPAVNLLGLADLSLPVLPPAAPVRFADQLQAWPREALALAVLGLTGWSARLAVADQLSAMLRTVKAGAGSLRRIFGVLAKRGYWIEHKVTLAGVHAPPLDLDSGADGGNEEVVPAGDTILVLVHLGRLGRELLQICGIQPAPSEWELLAAAHGSQVGARLAGPVCAFTYHARLRGYATALAAAEDVLLADAGHDLVCQGVFVRQGGEILPVTVIDKAAGGEPWPFRVAQPDRIAFVTLTPDLRDQLVARAQAAGAEHGLATDLQTLYNTQPARGPLWAVRW